MSQGTKNELIAARLARPPWWRSALTRLGVKSDERYQQTLKRLAQRDVSDTIGEEDVKSWLAMLESESARAAKEPRRP
jgi:hypothetical protein